MKKLTVIILLLALCFGALSGCGDIEIGSAPSAAPAQSASNILSEPIGGSKADDGPKGAAITLTGSGASVSGSGVSVSGSTVTIASPGMYSVTGTLDDGCIVVDTGEVKGDVTLTLKGADITCLGGPAIHVIEAKNFDLVLERDTHNRLVSGSADAIPAEKQDGAALFCEDDLDILGAGELEVLGYLNNGVTCKDDLDIEDGTIVVTAVNNGVKGSESVEIRAGSLTVTAGNDGVKTSSAKKEGKGFISIEGGTLDITAGGDGVAAESALTISGGELRVRTTGEAEGSSKALKAKTVLTVSGGTLEIDSEDHALHSAGDMELSGGMLTVASRVGKGVSAHGALEISGGTLDLQAADDGMEALSALTISGGELNILSGEDGLKAGSKTSGSGTILISGGTTAVSARGDAIDAKGGARITGGSFVGVGSAQTPGGFSADSAQLSLLFAFRGGEGTSARVVSDESSRIMGTVDARCGYTYALFSTGELSAGSYTLVDGTLIAAAKAK